MSFMTSPPCTFPYGLASDGSMVRDMSVFEAATVFAVGGALGGTARFSHPPGSPLRPRVGGGLIGLRAGAATSIGAG